MKYLVMIAVLFLTACAGTPTPQIPTIQPPKIVLAPVAVSCVPKNLPQAPSYSDTKEALLQAPGADIRYQLLAGNWGLRDARLTQLEGVVNACR